MLVVSYFLFMQLELFVRLHIFLLAVSYIGLLAVIFCLCLGVSLHALYFPFIQFNEDIE
jgi:hypothetical protein